ncbi:hypothetical protein SLEP1_g4177 [Rubroshorea leprosula]|uniref:GDSL esterase/lipase EXL3 n=1 Tax=Rubroshorea leprosula TaxID=152421 RepID=A0AAV5HWP5_9ROSI|nr:hypothetical protein SLEP1_g4177 [Rubroshorea leprosula]
MFSSSITRFLIPFLSLIGILFGTTTNALVKIPPNETIPALIVFGDSIVDAGNNNNINTLIKCDFAPYGRDFNGGLATGRFSNGKIPSDILVISLSEQINYFKEYISKLNGLVGEERTKFILANSLFLLVAGSDDIANTYFVLRARKLQYDVPAYTNLMVNSASKFIEELYSLGARRIGVFSAPPVGCVPSQRTLAGGIERECAENYNAAATLFNKKLSTELDSLSSSLPHSKIIYIDVYNPLLDIINRPQKYGFEVANKGCCGTGKLEVAVLCNKLSPSTCADVDKYIFWDSYHPTERGYRVLISQLLQKYVNKFF